MANVFWLLSSASYETLGLVFLEAAYYGLPSIGLRNYGVVEAIDEGRTGFFYSDQPLSRLVDDCKTAIRREDCIAHAERFSSTRFFDHLMSFA
jgi:glycosyltransferase involved in cell wall biosynthesis